MRTMYGSLLLTVGCLMGLGTIVVIVFAFRLAWSEDMAEAEPGLDGMTVLVAIASTGWGGFALVLGGLLMRRAASARGRWVVLAATVVGALAGFTAYFGVEIPNRVSSESLLIATNEGYDLSIPAFGTSFRRHGSGKVEWQGKWWLQSGPPSGTVAKAILWVVAVGLIYVFGAGLTGGTLALLVIRLTRRRH